MESESCLKKLKNDSDSTRKAAFMEKVKVLETKDLNQLKGADGRVSLGPITPNPNRENAEADLGCISPLTWASATPAVVCSNSVRIDENTDIGSPPQTPKEDVFDSFAPGPDNLMLAPRVNKYLGEARKHVSRRLNFDALDNSVEGSDKTEGIDPMEILLDEDVLLESIYESILDVIISNQIEGALPEILPEGPKTPTSLPLLSGIAETCPGAPLKLPSVSKDIGAPIKPMLYSRKIDFGICKKLEF